MSSESLYLTHQGCQVEEILHCHHKYMDWGKHLPALCASVTMYRTTGGPQVAGED